MIVKLWGARGSLPSPLHPKTVELRIQESLEGFFDTGYHSRDEIGAYLQALPAFRYGGYGGNTPCTEVRQGSTHLIVDGGSGIRLLGYELMNGPCGQGRGEVDLLFTHFHWDHLMGLMFFAPFFVPGNRINVYAVQPELKEVFENLFRKPFFPVPFSALGSTITFNRLEPRVKRQFGELAVTPYRLDHPDPCWGYRFEAEDKAFALAVDTECTRVSREEMGEDLKLYQGADFMIFDAQYTVMETLERVNWGHAAAFIGIDIALREGIKKVAFVHHDPAAADHKIANVEFQTKRYYEARLKHLKDKGEKHGELEWLFAREGMEFKI